MKETIELVEDFKIVLLNGEELIPNKNKHFVFNWGNKTGSMYSLLSTVLIDFDHQLRETKIDSHFDNFLYVGFSPVYGNCNYVKSWIPRSAIKEFVLLKK
jgi:hypothetical protein